MGPGTAAPGIIFKYTVVSLCSEQLFITRECRTDWLKLLILSRINRYRFPDFSCCWSAFPGRYRGPPQWRPRRKRTRLTLEQQERAEEDNLEGGASQVTPERFPNEV